MKLYIKDDYSVDGFSKAPLADIREALKEFGMVAVPAQPTCEMIHEGIEMLETSEGSLSEDAHDCYKAMIAAAEEV